MKGLFLVIVLMTNYKVYAQANETVMDNNMINKVLESQYKAAFQMLRQTIEKIPDSQWNTDEYPNPNWQIAYHALWSAKLYLGANLESYVPWADAIEGAESLGGTKDWENPEEGIIVEGHNAKEVVLSFITVLESDLETSISSLPLSEDSGFEWYPYSRLELHVNNIRHLQHHTAQLIERMKAKGITGFPWAIDGNPVQQW